MPSPTEQGQTTGVGGVVQMTSLTEQELIILFKIKASRTNFSGEGYLMPSPINKSSSYYSKLKL